MDNDTTVAFLATLGLPLSFSGINKLVARNRLAWVVMVTLTLPGVLLIYIGFNPSTAL